MTGPFKRSSLPGCSLFRVSGVRSEGCQAAHGSGAVEQVFLDLLARREALPADDPRLKMAITVMRAVGERAAEEFFRPENTRSYRDILTAAVADLRAVVLPSPDQPHKERP